MFVFMFLCVCLFFVVEIRVLSGGGGWCVWCDVDFYIYLFMWKGFGVKYFGNEEVEL